MIRRELRAWLTRWQEAVWAGVGIALGLWLAVQGGILLPPLGGLIALICAAWAIAAIRKTRLSRRADGPGIVELVEGRLRYLSPFYGGEVEVAEMKTIRIRTAPDHRQYWQIYTADPAGLTIPREAKGAASLADAFAALPGFDLGVAVRAFDKTQPGTITVWQAGGTAP
jgi:hypothetical protein